MPDTKKAVALGFNEQTEDAPKVLAKGKGSIAQQIIDTALSHEINIFSNKLLVDDLLKLELEEEIPSQLYQSVAELFAWLAQIEQKQI
jgi:flagellar biosynthesis protein